MLVLFPPHPAPRVRTSGDLVGLIDEMSPVIDDPDIELIVVAVTGDVVSAVVAAALVPDAISAALVAIGATDVWLLWRVPPEEAEWASDTLASLLDDVGVVTCGESGRPYRGRRDQTCRRRASP